MVRKSNGRRRLVSGLGSLALLASATVALEAGPVGATHPGINGKIACASSRGTGGNAEVFSFNPNGTELEATNLTNNAAFDGRPKYSPDGRQILFESNREGPVELYIMNADGTGLKNLTNSPKMDEKILDVR